MEIFIRVELRKDTVSDFLAPMCTCYPPDRALGLAHVRALAVQGPSHSRVYAYPIVVLALVVWIHGYLDGYYRYVVAI